MPLWLSPLVDGVAVSAGLCQRLHPDLQHDGAPERPLFVGVFPVLP